MSTEVAAALATAVFYAALVYTVRLAALAPADKDFNPDQMSEQWRADQFRVSRREQ